MDVCVFERLLENDLSHISQSEFFMFILQCCFGYFHVGKLEEMLFFNTRMWCFARFGTIYTILKKVKNTHVGCRLQPETLLKITLLHGCFSRFLNFTNDAKLHNASRRYQFLRSREKYSHGLSPNGKTSGRFS